MKLSVGLGCDRGALLETLNNALDSALSIIPATREHIAMFSTIDKKNDEAAFLDLTKSENKMLLFFSAEQLAKIPVPNPSNTVLKFMGTPAVSEAAALLAADTTMKNLLVEKHKLCGTDGKNVTISIARIPL